MTRTIATLLAGAAALSLPAAALAETIVFAHGYSPSHMMTTGGFEPFMACAQEATGGEVTFQHMPGGQIATMNESLEVVNNGAAQMTAITVAQQSSKLPLNGISVLPNMGDSSSEMVRAYRTALDSGGALAEEFADNRVHPLIVNLLPPYQIMSTLGPIDSLDKFSGLKVRVGGGAMTFTAEALETSPVEISAEFYIALERGTIDATFLSLTSVKTYSVNEIVNAISGNGSFGSGAMVLGIDTSAWEALSPEQQAALTDCGLTVETELAATLNSVTEGLKAEFAAEGIDVYDFTPEVKAAIDERLESVGDEYVARLEARGLPAREAYDAYRAGLAD